MAQAGGRVFCSFQLSFCRREWFLRRLWGLDKMMMGTEERPLLAGWALGWGSLTLRNLRSNPDIHMYEGQRRNRHSQGLVSLEANPIPPGMGALTCRVAQGSDPFTEGRN